MKKRIYKKEWSISELQDLEYGIKKGYSFETIQKKFLPFRTIEALKLKAKFWSFKHSKVWTDYELKVLKEELEKGMTYPQIRDEFLSHRNVKSIQQQARVKGWTKYSWQPWTNQDLMLLKKGMDDSLTYQEIVNKHLPNKKVRALEYQAQKHGWHQQSHLMSKGCKKWTERDIALFKQGIEAALTYKEIVNKYLPNRTDEALAFQARKQGWKAAQPWLMNELFVLDLK